MAAETVPPFFPVIIFHNPQTFSAVKTIFFMLIFLSEIRKYLVQ
ncbi:hypothetical protein B4065_3563 [Caldibacillus thermoamylovorans]|uniref:Uncharacterized protein n=1 Tax=Caldibacillus thermoamylovorans TaxID=35841 RepID=A0ABD4A8M0_9BACI|nr:hypothetical protein B4065_3563 [Caldibacillus thermoamylovorans]KIO63634.1 hypothetical protein B4166_0280 [Caldibacillus thermoamylovorans]KIO72960.1 hypothetical protein B4167_0281 [Caldibacillus thermoamylovorans]